LRALKVEEINGEVRETLAGSGAELAAVAAANGGSIHIEVSSRIKPEPLCLAVSADDGREVLWFRYTNRFGETLEVGEPALNSLYSPSGAPYPIASFDSTDPSKPDGYLGFEWALDYFKDVDPATNREIIRAVWKLLGKEVAVEQPKEEVPICSESGGVLACSLLPAVKEDEIFQAAVSTVSRLARECEKAKKRGLWKPTGTFRNPYFKRAAKGLRKIREILRQIPSRRLVCPAGVPQGCAEQTFPRAQILAQYENILKIKLPKGLKQLVKLYPAERRVFMSVLSQEPERYIVCGR
jgi:hypothetical protein